MANRPAGVKQSARKQVAVAISLLDEKGKKIIQKEKVKERKKG